jgi:hypothetical protein
MGRAGKRGLREKELGVLARFNCKAGAMWESWDVCHFRVAWGVGEALMSASLKEERQRF